ncbi:hypothetical protein [Geofilum rhodophaeum]|uniref:hypothetical protein n=1 Tax=Geofilum rhodophaeum TaxID=1965019 RepID=UPI000B529298|nr:hypothetical protein [Geofilum rhodophaeum]
MRNSDYTFFKGLHLELSNIRDDDERVLLSYKGENSPSPGFEKSIHRKDTYELIVNVKDIDNAYQVRTYGKYRGYTFGVFKLGKEGMVFIGTTDKAAYKKLNLTEVNQNWYGDDIQGTELDKIWEERTPTRGLPMPEGLERIKVVKS